MSTTIVGSDRQFLVWNYTVGHQQLLLRSTKSSDFPTRIDVFFKGVKQFHLPTTLEGLFITEATETEIGSLCSLEDFPSFRKDVKVFAVSGRGYIGYVAALVVAFHEDQGEYYEPSFFAKNNII